MASVAWLWGSLSSVLKLKLVLRGEEWAWQMCAYSWGLIRGPSISIHTSLVLESSSCHILQAWSVSVFTVSQSCELL